MHEENLTQRINALEDELARLKKEVAASKLDTTTTRRDVFRKLAIAGAGAAAGAAVLPTSSAQADTGDPMMLGANMFTTNAIRIRNGFVGSSVGPSLSTEATMFWVDNRQSSLPTAYGMRCDGKGVDGIGLWGHSDTNGIGVYGDGGIGLVGVGTRAGARIDPVGTPPPGRSDPHDRGEIVNDSNGTLWFCVASGTPGTWRRLASPDAAGQLHLLPAPARAYDSRNGGQRLNSDSQRPVGLRNGVAAGATVVAVPAEATGALVSLTIANTSGAGFLALFADGLSWPGNSSTNWSTAGQVLAVTTVSAVATSGNVLVYAGGTGSTDFILDVIGWYG